jgi:hypothetical protein
LPSVIAHQALANTKTASTAFTYQGIGFFLERGERASLAQPRRALPPIQG